MRRYRVTAVLTLTTAVLVLFLVLAWKVGIPFLVDLAQQGKGPSFLRDCFRNSRSPESVLALAAHAFRGSIAIVLAFWGLCVALALSPGRVLVRVPLLAAWWLAVELCVAPPSAGLLNLWQYFAIQDVDHRPKTRGPEFNDDFLRGTPPSREFRPEDLNLVFLGDSFTYGLRVKPEEAFPARVGVALREAYPGAGLKVANFGWTSSSPFLSHRRLVDIGERYFPDVVVLCVDMTDFYDDILYENMLARRGLYRFYDKLPITLHLWSVLSRESYLSALSWSVGGAPTRRFFAARQPLEESRPFLEKLAGNVRKLREWCRAHGADFALVVLPRSFQYSERECPANWEQDEYTPLGPYSLEAFRWVDELRKRVGYPVFSLLPDFQRTTVFPTCFHNDPHWNPQGHRVAAEALVRKLRPVIGRRLAQQ